MLPKDWKALMKDVKIESKKQRSDLLLAPSPLAAVALLLIGFVLFGTGSSLESIDNNNADRLIARHELNMTIHDLILVKNSQQDSTTSVNASVLCEVVGAREFLATLAT